MQHSRAFYPAPNMSDFQIEATVEHVASCLFSLLNSVKALAFHMDGLSDVVGEDGRKTLALAVDQIGTQIEAEETRFLTLFDAVDAMTANAGGLRSCLRDQNNDLRLAAMISTNARVVSSGIPEDDGALAHFASGVRQLLERASLGVAKVQDRLLEADSQIAKTLPRLSKLTQNAAHLRKVKEELVRKVGDLSHPELEVTASLMQSCLADLTGALEVAVDHLQAGDAARQRYEHAEAILAASVTCPVEYRGAITSLANAQFKSATQALHVACSAIGAELARMSDLWQTVQSRLTGFAGSKTSDDLSAFVAMLSGILEGAERWTVERSAIEPAINDIAGLYSGVGVLVEDATRYNRDMGLSGINAILVSKRLGDRGLAMMEVSRQLREATSQIGRQSDEIAALSQAQEQSANALLRATRGSLKSDLEGLATGLEHRIDSFAKHLSQVVAQSNDIGHGDPFLRLRTLLDQLAGGVERASDNLPDSQSYDEVNGPLRDLVDSLRTLYTMKDERDIHDALFPRTHDGGAAVGSAPAHDDEDIFF